MRDPFQGMGQGLWVMTMHICYPLHFKGLHNTHIYWKLHDTCHQYGYEEAVIDKIPHHGRTVGVTLHVDHHLLVHIFPWWRIFYLNVSSRTRNPPYLGDLFNKKIFEVIFTCFRLRNNQHLNYRDMFCWVQEMIKSWNYNITQKYYSPWLSCLDESMVDFHNHLVPGWMIVNRKPHPYGNEYHTHVDALTSVIYFVGIIKVRDNQNKFLI